MTCVRKHSLGLMGVRLTSWEGAGLTKETLESLKVVRTAGRLR